MDLQGKGPKQRSLHIALENPWHSKLGFQGIIPSMGDIAELLVQQINITG